MSFTRLCASISFVGLSLVAVAEDKRLSNEEIISKLFEGLTENERVYAEGRLKGLSSDHMRLGGAQGGRTAASLREGEFGSLTLDGEGAKILQIINESEMLVQGGEIRSREESGSVWVEGIDTSGLTDDSQVDFGKTTFMVKGTKSYTTITGAKRTVKRLVVIDAEKVDAIASKAVKIQASRDWRDSTGEIVISGRFKQLKDNLVQIERRDNDGIFEYPMADMGEDDQAIIRQELKRRSEEKRKAEALKKKRKR